MLRVWWRTGPNVELICKHGNHRMGAQPLMLLTMLHLGAIHLVRNQAGVAVVQRVLAERQEMHATDHTDRSSQSMQIMDIAR